jgi:hypothetical protein
MAGSDIPCRFVPSKSGSAVSPGGGSVTRGAGLEATVQNADEPVRELAEGCVETDLSGPERVVVGPGAG